MKIVELQGEVRGRTGKEVAKKLRQRKLIPAIVYGRGVESLPIAVPSGALLKVLEAGENVIIKLTLTDEDPLPERLVILKELQRHPVRDEILHVDFLEISMERRLRVTVPIHLIGEAVGKTKGGIVEQYLREVPVECLPTAIPDRIEVDISSLDVGDTLHLKDLSIGEGIKMLEDPERPVVSIVEPEVEEAGEKGE